MTARARKDQVFAIVRVDDFIEDELSRIAVVEVLPTPEEADHETRRLNAINGAKGARYVVRATRYYPDGRAGAAKDSD